MTSSPGAQRMGSETEAKARSLSWEALEQRLGTDRAQDMFRFAETFGKARHAIIVWSMGITQHAYGSDNVRAIVNLQLAKGNIGREHTGLMPIRGHSGVQGGAEMGGQPSAYVMGFPVSEENAKKFAAPERWGFEPPSWKGLSAAHMVLAADRGEIDALWQTGGNFRQTLPEPDLVNRALSARSSCAFTRTSSPIRRCSSIRPIRSCCCLRAPATSSAGAGRRPAPSGASSIVRKFPGRGRARRADEWEIPVMLVARKLDPERASGIFPWRDTQDIREEIDRVCPTYKGIAEVAQEGR